MRDLSEFAAHARRLWWLVAIEAVVALLVVTVVLAIVGSEYSERTTQLVLHPASALPATQVPAAVDGLRPDGSLVQTVLHVLGSDQLLQRAARAGGVRDVSRYSISASVQPGSAFFEQTIRGPDAKVLPRLTESLNALDTAYVKKAFSAYNLDSVGATSSTHNSFPPKAAVALLALLLGAAFALAIIFVEWWVNEPKRAGRDGADAVGGVSAPADNESKRDVEYDVLFEQLRHAVGRADDSSTRAPTGESAPGSEAVSAHEN